MNTASLDSEIKTGNIQLGRGNIISSKDIASNPGDYPIYSSSAKGTGEFGRYGDYMFDEELITWSVDGGGRFFFRPKHKFSVTNVSGFMRIDDNAWNKRFVYYCLDLQHQRIAFDYQTKAHPSVIRHLYQLPTLDRPEQTKIAEVLSTVDRAIEQTEALIAKQQRIKTGLMQDLLTKGIDEHGNLRSEATHEFKDSPLGRIPVEWEVIQLSQIADISSGLTLGKTHSGPNTIELPYLRVANVQDGYLDLSDVTMIRVPNSFIAKYQLLVGDVLMNEGGDFDKLGRGTVWRGEIDICLHQNHVFKVRPYLEQLESEYLAAVSASPYGKAFFMLASKQSTNLASINSTQLKSFPIPLPALSEQKALVELVRAHSETLESSQQERRKLESIKTALMQDLLTGKKRVTPLLESAATD